MAATPSMPPRCTEALSPKTGKPTRQNPRHVPEGGVTPKELDFRPLTQG